MHRREEIEKLKSEYKELFLAFRGLRRQEINRPCRLELCDALIEIQFEIKALRGYFYYPSVLELYIENDR